MYFTLYYISTITVCRMVYYPLVCGRLMPLEEEEVPLDEYLHNIAHLQSMGDIQKYKAGYVFHTIK